MPDNAESAYRGTKAGQQPAILDITITIGGGYGAGMDSVGARRILLVDSDSRAADEVRRILAGGYEVLGCPSCEAARTFLRARADDCAMVLLALRFESGRMSGEEFLALVTKSWPQLEVVVLSAVAELPRVSLCLRAGAFDYLEKRRMAETLKATVARACEVTRVRRQRLAHEREVERLCAEERRLRAPSVVTRAGDEKADVTTCPDRTSTPSRLIEMERAALAHELRLAHGNVAEAARRLGLTKMSCWRRVRKCGLEPERWRSR